MTKNYTEKDLGLSRIIKELGVADGAHVAVGILSDKSTWAQGADANLADIAMFNEFGHLVRGGSYSVIPRPFMRRSFDKNIGQIVRKQQKLQSDVFEGSKTEIQALDKLGEYFRGRVFSIFRTGGFAPNAPSTIKKKGSSTPLIDDGHLRQSIHHEVRT